MTAAQPGTRALPGDEVDFGAEALDRLQPTEASHGRVIILEVMGRDAGHIALVSGIAGGADVILIPEISYDLDVVAERLESAGERGNNFALMIVAEAVTSPDGGAVTGDNAPGRATYGGVGHALAAQLSEMVSAEIRVTVLGHVQRGGEALQIILHDILCGVSQLLRAAVGNVRD